METFSPVDPSSFSRPDLAIVTHISMSLDVDFERKVFSGTVNLIINKLDKNVNEVVLDAKDLCISSIYEREMNNKSLAFNMSEAVGEFGSKLTVELPPKDSNVYNLIFHYSTSPKASGLQWLLPIQTEGQKLPFVYSHFEAVHARSFLPCQDTPYVKTKYTAVITAPRNMTVLMSGVRKEYKSEDGCVCPNAFYFEQDIPIPSYLIAIVIGALESREIGPRSHVWAEAGVVDAAAYEFAETESQLATAEAICGPYVWGIYDLLVLPPSFPLGGMENPCLTFVTPTLIAGDRSLATVVAHEISHSWTGNLVTNKNFEHFWLNEGFTMFLERKIKGRLAGHQSQDFSASLGLNELRETVNRLGSDNPLTSLVVNLSGVHPDDSFSLVPYEKGHIFLRYLENVVGGPEAFEEFIRKYFESYKYKSIDTNDFKEFFEDNFKDNNNISEIDWDKWLHSPGMPPVIPEYDDTLAKACDALQDRILNWDEAEKFPLSEEDYNGLITDQKIYLLQNLLDLPTPLTVSKLKILEDTFKLKDAKNSELKCRWLRTGLKAHWEEKVDQALNWINHVGRMKFVRPIYRDLYEWEEMRSRAIENFRAHEKYMMHVSSYSVAKDLHLVE